MLHRVQETLAHKLGTLPQDQTLTKDTLKDYLHMFDDPLPQETIVTFSCLLKLDCQLTAQANSTVLDLASHSEPDLDDIAMMTPLLATDPVRALAPVMAT